MRFDPAVFGPDLDAYFRNTEAVFDDITPGCEKRVVWFGDANAQTDWAVVYIHGFSATSEEIRPVPDLVARRLGANLVYTRLRGHGRTGAAMVEGSVKGWLEDFDEAVAAARQVGRRVLILSTSTGGTLLALRAGDPEAMAQVAGAVFVAPNFAINNPLAGLLTWPAARVWGPWVGGRTRSFDVRNDRHGTYWTTEYPTIAAIPVAECVAAAAKVDLGAARVPALFFFSDQDQIVKAEATRAAISRWGGAVTVVNPELTAEDDVNCHVVAGDTLSPNQTAFAAETMGAWAAQL